MSKWLDRDVSIRPDVISQSVNKEMVLLDMESEHYFGLDAIGARIWSLLQSESSVRSIFETLLAEYDVSPEVLTKDLEEFLDRLNDDGLLSFPPTEPK